MSTTISLETKEGVHDKKMNPAQDLAADDQAAMAAIGAKQGAPTSLQFLVRSGVWSVLKRNGISASVAQALICGGPVGLLWGFVVSAVGMTCVAASLSELSSIWPSAGAQYVWVSQLSPKKIRPLLSWIVVWLSLTSAWLGTVSCCYGAAVQSQAYIVVTTPSYVPQRWHVSMIYWAFLTVMVLINVYGIRIFHIVNQSAMALFVVGFFLSMIVLLATTRDKHSASYVFTTFQNNSGWESDGVAFLIGLLSATYGFIAIEQPTHYAEEIKHVRMNLPRALFTNVLVNAIITFPWLVALLYCIGDIDALLDSPIGYSSPFTQIFINSTGSVAAGIIINVFSTILAFVAGVNNLGAAARILWSLARDKGLPHFLTKIHPKWDVPMRTMVVVAIPSYLVGIIYIFNSTAFYGIMAGQIIAMILSYFMPIMLHLLARRSKKVVYGPWTLGRWGWLTDAVSVCFTVIIAVFMSFPVHRPVTIENMNYASVLNAAVMFFAAISWFAYGRGRYTGEIPEVPANGPEVIDGEELAHAIPTTSKLSDIKQLS